MELELGYADKKFTMCKDEEAEFKKGIWAVMKKAKKSYGDDIKMVIEIWDHYRCNGNKRIFSLLCFSRYKNDKWISWGNIQLPGWYQSR